MRDAIHNIAGKRVHQHAPRRLQADAARAQIKNVLSFKLPDGRAVRAFHVIRKNLQLRLGVDRRVVGQQQIAVGLLGVGLLRVGPHENFAVENALRFAVQNAVIKFVLNCNSAWRDESTV